PAGLFRHPRACAQRPCARPAPPDATTLSKEAPSQAGSPGDGAVKGPPWAFALKSSDATNVRWAPYDPDQGPGRDSSLLDSKPQGFSEGSYRAVPVEFYLGIRRRILKLRRKRLEVAGQPLGALDQHGIGAGRFGRRRVRGSIGLALDHLVGEQQRGEQELARFG